MFVCVRTDCPNHTKQPLYCIFCNEDDPSTHEHKVKPISFQASSLQKLWLDLRKEVSTKVSIVNEWLATYKNLLGVLTQFCGQNELKIAIDKLVETEESIGRYYESNVQVHAQAEDLVKLSTTKQSFDQFTN